MSAPADLGPYVPALVRAWSEEDDPPRARQVDGSLVSVDISGFTALAERLQANGKAGAEELVTRISAVFDALIEVAERHGGDVLKFRGDALLLLYHGPRHAERACGAASDMQWTIERVGTGESSVGPFELRMSVGVHSEPVTFLLTEVPHRELVVVGPAASRVFELEDAASAGEIVISPQTAAAVPADWLDEARGGDTLMRRLPPGASPLPPPARAAGRDLSQYVPASLRGHLAVTSGEAEHRQVTVSFLKLSGTDALLAEHGPEALLARVDRVADAVAAASAAYGITWLESDIDVGAIKLYLTAGAPVTAGDDSEAMVRCLRDVLAADTGLVLRAGVNRGHVFTGDIGASSRSTYAVMGDAVNLAARLTARAEPGEILATGAVLDRARTRYATTERTFTVKGKALPVVAHALGEALGPRDDPHADAVPLIGRDAELGLLEAGAAAARRGSLQAFEVVADPGMGKSRLVQELQARWPDDQAFHVAAESYAQSEPYSAVRDLLRRILSIPLDAPAEEAGALLRGWADAAAPELGPWLPLLAIPFGAVVEPTPETRGLDPAASRERLLRTAEAFLSLALTDPTLLVVEDAHWLDDASAFLLAHVLQHAPERPWLVVLTMRPTDGTLLPSRRGTRMVLEPLDSTAADALASAVASEHGLPADAVAAVAARAAGNPLFLRELAFAARDGTLRTIPDTVESLLTMRFDRLEPTDRVLLRYASVLGAGFDLALLEAALRDDVPDAGDPARWERLGEFVVPGDGGSIAFRHDLVRATAYEGLSFRRRRDIHGKVGHALVARLGPRAEDEAALLSLHFHHAELADETWRYSVVAGDRAASGFANVVAAELYGRALAAAERAEGLAPQAVARVAESLGDVSERAARYDAADEAYARAAGLVGGSPIDRIRLDRKLGVLLERRGQYEEAESWFAAALGALGDIGDPAAQADLAELELEYGVVLYRRGRYADCAAWCRKAAERARACDDLSALAHAYRLLDTADRALGGLDESWLERALPLYDRIGDRLGKAIALNNLGIRAYYAGRWDEAEAHYAASRAIELEVGDVVRAVTCSNNEAEILLDQGRVAEAVPLFKEALRVYRGSGYAFGAAVVTMNLARCAAVDDRPDEAEELFAAAAAELEAIGATSFVLETGMRRAEALAREGRAAAALALAEETIASCREAGELLPREATLERVRGLAAARLGDLAAARTHLVAAVAAARTAGNEFEEALALRALADAVPDAIAEDDRATAERTLARLGVARLPWVAGP